MKSLKILDVIVFALLLVGGCNWGLLGLFNFNLLGSVFGDGSFWARLLYSLVGLSALYEIVFLKTEKERWHCTGTIRAHVEA